MVRLVSRRCAGLAAHIVHSLNTRCYWSQDFCKTQQCFWAHYHQLPADSTLRAQIKALLSDEPTVKPLTPPHARR